MAKFHLLSVGYGGDRVASTVSVVIADGALVVIDPGMVSATSAILDPLAALGFDQGEVSDIVLSHHHPDHTMNIALFPNAKVHDHWAIYQNDEWTARPAEGFHLADDVVLWETPGHTPQDITTVVADGSDTVAFTHLWWYESAPFDDPLATDPEGLHRGRERVLEVATLIVPGHGHPFPPTEQTSR